MSDLDLDAIRRREVAATEGPWVIGAARVLVPNPDRPHRPVSPPKYVVARHIEFADDAVFIAHAREDIPALLDEVDRLRDDLDARFEHSDHKAAKYYRQMREAERDRDAALAKLSGGDPE